MYYNNYQIEDLPNEVWVDVIGFDGVYEVSSLGRVKSCGRYVKTHGGEKWNKPRILRQGNKTRCVTLSYEGITHPYTVQRLVYESFNLDFVDYSKGEVVERINKIKDDNRVENLKKSSFNEFVKNKTEKGCMIFDRYNNYTKEHGIFHDGKLISKKCKCCGKQKKPSEFTYGFNMCKDCRNDKSRTDYKTRVA